MADNAYKFTETLWDITGALGEVQGPTSDLILLTQAAGYIVITNPAKVDSLGKVVDPDYQRPVMATFGLFPADLALPNILDQEEIDVLVNGNPFREAFRYAQPGHAINPSNVGDLLRRTPDIREVAVYAGSNEQQADLWGKLQTELGQFCAHRLFRDAELHLGIGEAVGGILAPLARQVRIDNAAYQQEQGQQGQGGDP